MLTSEQFIAVAERDVKVMQAMLQVLETITQLHLMVVEIEGMRGRLIFTREMKWLTEAIKLMGHDKSMPNLPVDLGQ